MKHTLHGLRLLLGMGCLLGALAACDGWPKPTTPTPTPAATVPSEIASAREAALAYLRHAYPQRAPPAGLAWTSRSTGARAVAGSSSYELASGKWLLTIGVPVIAPGELLYEMELSNQDTGFHWMGKLNDNYAILESNLDVAVDVLIVRDTILSFVREHYPDQSPAGDMPWVGERTTPEGSVGHESCRFTDGDWVMTVEYDLLPPDQMSYQVGLHRSDDSFAWRGQVDAQGVVLEERLPG